VTYNWQTDAVRCYDLALHFMALRIGSRRPANGFEWYWLEAQGLIP
jgi:hypothetical protein